LTGFVMLTVHGLNFGLGSAVTPSVRRGDNQNGHCSTASWTANTKLLCAQGEPLRELEQYQNTVTVTISSKYNGCGVPSFSFDVPFITEAYRNGPYVAGSRMLLRGTHFRSVDLTPSAGIAAGADATTDLAPTCSWTALTQIACAANRVNDVSKTATVNARTRTHTGTPRTHARTLARTHVCVRLPVCLSGDGGVNGGDRNAHLHFRWASCHVEDRELATQWWSICYGHRTAVWHGGLHRYRSNRGGHLRHDVVVLHDIVQVQLRPDV
jgi:hypothetical protein